MTRKHAKRLDTSDDALKGLRVWCETTPADDTYAEYIAGYCPECRVTRTQRESGFLYCALVVELHDEQGERFDYAPAGKLLFSDHVCCATCGSTLTRPPTLKPSAKRVEGQWRETAQLDAVADAAAALAFSQGVKSTDE